MTRHISGKNIIIKENFDKNDYIYKEEVPIRIPFTILDSLNELGLIKENDNLLDINCSSGDLLLYCKINFKINDALGINNYSERHLENSEILNRYYITIINCEAITYIYNWDKTDVFWLWMEEPKTEIEVLKLIQDSVVNHGHRKCKVLIAYETMQNICKDNYLDLYFLNKIPFYNKKISCNHCANIRYNINKKWDDNKIQNIEKVLKEHNNNYNNRKIETKQIYFNISDKCRQSGIFSIICVHFN